MFSGWQRAIAHLACTKPVRAMIERDKTATIHPSLPWEPWQNVTKRDKTRSKREVTVTKRREMPANTHAFRPTTGRLKVCYGLLRTVTFSFRPFLLRSARFLIHTVTAVAFFDSLKILPSIHSNHNLHVCPSLPTLSHVHPVLFTLKRDCPGCKEHNINLSLYIYSGNKVGQRYPKHTHCFYLAFPISGWRRSSYPFYGAYIYQLFSLREYLVIWLTSIFVTKRTVKLLKQWVSVSYRRRVFFSKFYGRHYKLISKYDTGLTLLL